jgi:hypothetical protein
MEIFAVFRPDQSKTFLARLRTWIDTHTDQAIVFGSSILGFWLIANSVNLILALDRSLRLTLLSGRQEPHPWGVSWPAGPVWWGMLPDDAAGRRP